MAGLSIVAIFAIFTVLLVGVSGQDRAGLDIGNIQHVDWNEILRTMCQMNPTFASSPVCSSFTTKAPATTTHSPSTSEDPANAPPISTESSTPSTPATTVKHANWCRLGNGSFVPRDYMFINATCSFCRCLPSKSFSCAPIPCMPAYCIDGSAPVRRAGQCCAQCRYENNSNACVINGIPFPHGTIFGRTGTPVQCWCQLGTIECRRGSGSPFSSLDLWGEGTAIYIIVIIIVVVLLLGSLLCCGCFVIFYFYYQRQQQVAQQAYDQYYNNAGWQPMGDEGESVDGAAEEKKAEAEAEAEQNVFEYPHPTENSEQYVPPPYALYNGSYVNEQPEKEQ